MPHSSEFLSPATGFMLDMMFNLLTGQSFADVGLAGTDSGFLSKEYVKGGYSDKAKDYINRYFRGGGNVTPPGGGGDGQTVDTPWGPIAIPAASASRIPLPSGVAPAGGNPLASGGVSRGTAAGSNISPAGLAEKLMGAPPAGMQGGLLPSGMDQMLQKIKGIYGMMGSPGINLKF